MGGKPRWMAVFRIYREQVACGVEQFIWRFMQKESRLVGGLVSFRG